MSIARSGNLYSLRPGHGYSEVQKRLLQEAQRVLGLALPASQLLQKFTTLSCQGEGNIWNRLSAN